MRQSLGVDVRILTLIRVELRVRAFGNFQRFQRHVRLKGLPHWSVCRKCTIYWFIISSRERHGSLSERELEGAICVVGSNAMNYFMTFDIIKRQKSLDFKEA